MSRNDHIEKSHPNDRIAVAHLKCNLELSTTCGRVTTKMDGQRQRKAWKLDNSAVLIGQTNCCCRCTKGVIGISPPFSLSTLHAYNIFSVHFLAGAIRLELNVVPVLWKVCPCLQHLPF
jgi:hypothetical protein